MKATWSFEYDPMAPEEVTLINNLQKAEDFKRTLWDYDQWLRGLLKYGDLTDLTDVQANVYQECRDKLWEFMKEGDINLYEV